MLKLTKTGIGLLTKQYRSVLRKCLLLNLGFITLVTSNSLSSAPSNYIFYSQDQSILPYYSGVINQNEPGLGLIFFDQADIPNHGMISQFFKSGNYISSLFVPAVDSGGTAITQSGNPIAIGYTISYRQLINNFSSLDSAIGSKIANDGKYIKASNTNSVTANLRALDDAFNYYYTKDEVKA